MCIKAAFNYALKILFSRSTKKTVGTKSIKGAIICIALSLIPLVVVISVSDAMISGITERLINLSSGHLQVQYELYQGEKIDLETLDVYLSLVKNTKGVKDAYEMISATGLVASSKARCGATIRACKPEIFSTVDSYKKLFSASDGDLKDFASSNKNCALIGKGIAERLNLKSGDTLRLITTQKINGKITPHLTSFKVSAIISCGYQELDSLWVFIPLEYGAEILKPDTSLTTIMVETENPFGTQGELIQVQKRIERVIDFSASVYRWDELNQTQYENFSSTRMLLVVIMLLIVLVACINISSCIVMIAMDRRKEIAILKSVGTSKSTISLAFVFTGFLIGGAGILIGIPCGILISLNVNRIIWLIEQTVNLFAKIGYFIPNGNLNSFYEIHIMNSAYYLETIPIHIPFFQILFYIISTLILSLITSLIPAIKAGREKVIETFRKAGS